jgi:ABC-type glycerol-3-phosphate transport system permease component
MRVVLIFSFRECDYGKRNRARFCQAMGASGASTLFAILVTLWVAVGFIGFVTSIFCFTKHGASESALEHNFLGLVSSIVLGPFYWIYFDQMRKKYGYCASPVAPYPSTTTAAAAPVTVAPVTVQPGAAPATPPRFYYYY